MSETTPTPVTGTPLGDINPGTHVRWPLVALLAAAATIAAGAVIVGEHYAGINRVVKAGTKALDDGGIVSKHTLRATLREMRIECTPGAGGGMSCHVEIPKAAD